MCRTMRRNVEMRGGLSWTRMLSDGLPGPTAAPCATAADVRDGLLPLGKEPEARPWSSAAAHCGTAQPDGALDMEVWRERWNEATWCEYLAARDTEEANAAIRRCTIRKSGATSAGAVAILRDADGSIEHSDLKLLEALCCTSRNRSGARATDRRRNRGWSCRDRRRWDGPYRFRYNGTR